MALSATELLDLLRRKEITVREFLRMADDLSESELRVLSELLQREAAKTKKAKA